MITSAEIKSALAGSWLLFRNRDHGMAYFDLSVTGFWRSFAVIFLLLPMFLVSAAAERKLILTESTVYSEGFPDNAYWSAQAVGLFIDWVTLPLLLLVIARPIGISQRYVPFVVVRNWTSVLASAPYVATGVLYLAGAVSSGIMVLLSLICMTAVLWYRYLVARIALGANAGLAVGIVVLDVLLSLVIGELAGRFWAL